MPWFIGRLVEMLANNPPGFFLEAAEHTLYAMAVVILIARPAAIILQRLIINQAIVPPFTTLIRWQSHWHVVRQSLAFFQNDFAGRISNRVMQAGHALRETIVSLIRSVLHIFAYCLGAAGLMLAQGSAPCRTHLDLGRALCRAARLDGAKTARTLTQGLGGALAGDRQGRRQLHQYPDRQALRAGEG